MTLLNFTEAKIRQQTSAESFQRGREYYQRGAVVSLVQRRDTLEADVWGSETEPYRVRVALAAGGLAGATCTCPYDWGGWCKHIAAALLAGLHQPEKIEERPPLPELLSELDRAQLQTLLLKLAEYEPPLVDVIEAQVLLLATPPAHVAASPAAPPHPVRAPVDPEPFRRQIRALLRSLERRRPWEAYGYVSGVVEAVSSVLDQAWKLIEAGDGRNALVVLEAITTEYLAGWEMLDGSDGEASVCFEDLGAAWTEALLTADLTPEERQAWTTKLEAWQGELADYGVDAFDAALAAAVQGWDYPPLRRVLQGEITERGAWEGEAPASADELAEARLHVLERQGRYQEYLYLAEAESQVDCYATMLARLGRGAEAVEYGRRHLTTTEEALTLAKALWERGEVERGLEIAQHGLTLEGLKGALAFWLRDRAAEQGQSERALAAARIAFEADWSLATYRKVQELAGADWPAHQAELLERLRKIKSYYPQGPVEIFLHEGLISDAIAAVEEGASHTLVEQVVDVASASHPDWVIEACRRQAESIMGEGKAQYYDAAARWLGKARTVYQAAGREQEWQVSLAGLLDRHQRKYKLVPLLKALK
jgi:uncharacterized Zn finger protein